MDGGLGCFDTGTGIGSLLVGFIAVRTSFGGGLSITAALCVFVAIVVLVRILVSRRRPAR